MAASKIIVGFMLAGTLAACSGEQMSAASDATLPADTAKAGVTPKELLLPPPALGLPWDPGASETHTQFVQA